MAETDGSPASGSRPPWDVLARMHELARRRPDEVAQRFVDAPARQDTLTYAELADLSGRIAAGLVTAVGPGQPVILLVPTCRELAAALFGVWRSGGTAVVVALPIGREPDAAWSARVRTVIHDSGARCVVAQEARLDGYRKALDLSGGIFRTIENLVATSSPATPDAERERDTLALLQYTSGSTSAPKGVMITDHNLSTNLESIRQSLFEPLVTDADSRTVATWLPAYHDMGMASLLWPLWNGTPGVLMRPETFVMAPHRWLQAISDHSVYFSAAPNFAYELCATRVKEQQRAGLDLSSWRVALTGAEAPKARTLSAFTAAFSGHGFDPAAWTPCYGLAEATVLVSGRASTETPTVTRFARDSLTPGREAELASDGAWSEFVACGPAAGLVRVEIRDPATAEVVPDGVVGEIVVEGANVAAGYWHDPVGTAERFVSLSADVRRFRTADHGLIHDGQLYVIGRADDVIVTDGRNIYPDDVESALSGATSQVRFGRIAAVPSLETGGIDIVAEVRPAADATGSLDRAEVAAAIRRVVSTEFSLRVTGVYLVRPGQIPRTSSGKVQRRRCRKLLRDGSLAPWG